MNDIQKIFKKAGIPLSDRQIEQFGIYREFLLQYNEKVNLTAITDETEVNVKHFLDSVLGQEFLPQGSKVADVGTGAGFPALPLKIVRPDLTFTLVDGLQKRIDFLEQAVQKIGLDGVTCRHLRAEECAKISREKFDAVVARAVAKLPTLLEYCLPLVKVGGIFVAYKTDETELQTATNALRILGAGLKESKTFSLPDGSKRTIFVFQKVKSTPKLYPRPQNRARTFPL